MTTEARPRTLAIELPEHFLLRRLRVLSIPSANTFVAWNRARAFYRFKQLKRLYALHILAAQSGGRWGEPAERVVVEIVRRTARLLDTDNFTAGAKYLLDALKRQGIVVDDSPGCLELVVRQEKTRQNRGIVVTVTEVCKGA